MHNITSTTHPNLSFYLRETYRICNFLANCCDYARKQYKAPISFSPEVYETSSKTGSRIRILYLLTGPICVKSAVKSQPTNQRSAASRCNLCSRGNTDSDCIVYTRVGDVRRRTPAMSASFFSSASGAGQRARMSRS